MRKSSKIELSSRRRAYFYDFACLLVGGIFGTNLGSFWGAYGDQVGSNSAFQGEKVTMLKKVRKRKRFWNVFLTNFVAFWGPWGGSGGGVEQVRFFVFF